jgi:hypothetical protein
MAGNPLLPTGILRFALVSSPCHALGKGVEAGLNMLRTVSPVSSRSHVCRPVDCGNGWLANVCLCGCPCRFPKPATAAPCNNRRRLTGECIGLVESNKSHGSTSTGCRRPREVDTVESLAFRDPQSDLLLRPSFEEPMHQGFVGPT